MAATAANLGIGILQVHLLLRWWGPEAYAGWNVVLAAIAILGSLDYGQAIYFGNEFMRCEFRQPHAGKIILHSGVWCASLLAGVELVLAAVLIFAAPTALTGTAAPLERSWRTALFIYLGYWAVLGAPAGMLGKLYLPAGQFSRLSWIMTLQRLVGFGCLLAAVQSRMSLAAAMAAQCLGWSGIHLWMLADLRRAFPEFYPFWRGGSFATAWKNFARSLPLSLANGLQQSASNGLLLLGALFLSAPQIAVFAALRTAANLVMQGSTILVHPLMPEFIRYRETRAGTKLGNSIRAAWLIGTTATCLGLAVGLPLAQRLIEAWTDRTLPWEPELLALLLLAVTLRQWSHPLHSYLHATNQIAGQLVTEFIRAGAAFGWVAFTRGGGVESLGWALLLGEAFGGCCLLFWVRGDLRLLGSPVTRESVLPPVAQILCLGLVIWGWIAWPPFVPGILAGGFVILGLGLFNWLGLPHDLKVRLLHPIREFRNKAGWFSGPGPEET